MSTPRLHQPPSSSSSLLLDVPNQRSRSHSRSHTPPHTGGGTTPIHMTVTLGDGRIVDADVTYTTSRSHGATLPNSPYPHSLPSVPALLVSRQLSDPDVFAALTATFLSIEKESTAAHTPPSSVAGSLHCSSDSDIENIQLTNDDTDPLLSAVHPGPGNHRPVAISVEQKIGSAACNTVSTGVVYSLAAITAAPTALNALAAPSGKSPGEFGPAWWNDMSNLTRAHSVANGVSSFLINIIMNALFLPAAWKKFRTSIVHIFDSLEEFLDNTFSIILALGGALAAAAIAYNAFLWLPLGAFLAIIPASIAFLITIAQRYSGVKSIFRRIRNLFNEDARTQQELADAVQHIDKKYLDEIEARFQVALTELLASRDAAKPLTEDEVETLLVKLSNILSEMQMQHPDLIKDKTTLEYITRYTGILFDMTFALLVIVPPAFLVHMQKGFDGVNKAKELITGTPLPSMHVLLECLIGLNSAVVNAIFYGNSALEIRATTVEIVKYLYQHPRSIAFALPLLLANGFSSGGMQSVATGVVKNKNNLFHLTANTPAADALVATMTAGGFVVNFNASGKKAWLSGSQPAKTVTVTDMAKRAANTNDQVISHQSGDAMRGHSFFTNKRRAEARAREAYERDPIPGPTFV